MGVFSENTIIGASNASGYDIDYSLKCNGGSDAHWANATAEYLARTVSSGAGDSQRKFTLSCWVKLGAQAQFSTDSLQVPYRCIYAWGDGNGNSAIGLSNTGTNSGFVCLKISSSDAGGSYYYNWASTPLMRDVAEWYHLVVNIDTTQGSQSNRIKAWLNNEQITAWGTQYRPDSNQDVYINGAGHVMLTNYIGAAYRTANNTIFNGWDGYIAEMHALDGIIKAPTDFAELDEDTNEWKAIKYKGSYGATGIYLKFDDSSALGTDDSGNGNNFTVTGFTATDQVIDSPQNSTGSNFCTLSRLVPDYGTVTYTNAGLSMTRGGDDTWGTVASTMAPQSGKWYFEGLLHASSGTLNTAIGLAGDIAYDVWRGNSNGRGASGSMSYSQDGSVIMDGSYLSPNPYGATYAVGDIIGVAFDLDASPKTCTFYKNNTIVNATFNLSSHFTNSVNIAPILAVWGREKWTMNFGQDSSFDGGKTAQGNTDGAGNGDFYYSPPSGYLALCSNNLSDPAIALPGEHFNTLLYTGTGSARTVTGVGFDSDLIWIKNRSAVANHVVQDRVRGGGNRIAPNTTGIQGTDPNGMTAFATDGFTIGGTGGDASYNTNTATYVAWNWKAGGAYVTNTEGSMDSLVSANPTAGFSIVKMDATGTGSTATIGHGLSQAPVVIIGKPYNAGDNWRFGSTYLNSRNANAWTYNAILNTDVAEYQHTNVFDGTAPTATLVTMGSDGLNNGSYQSILYCFHAVEGYSKFGYYIGNGNANGAFIYTGFRPAFVMTKRLDSANDWRMFDNKRDPFNVNYRRLNANLDYAEGTETWNYNDFLSNGFKWRVSDGGYNASGGRYVYMAFAESPFKTSRAR